ncbi:MAG: DUF4358 domain-containing protein [Ruminococcus sp.]|nr:DUF4358 domain-containing protein [Ruminococcus sp.]
MKKLTAILVALCLTLALAGCGSGESSSEKEESKPSESVTQTTPKETDSLSEDTSSEVEQTVESKLPALAEKLAADYPEVFTGSALYGSAVFEKNCKKLFACEATDLKDGMIIFSNGGGIADEVSVVYPADGNAQGQTKMLEARKEIRYGDFNGYVPEELPKIEAGKVFTVGDAAVLIISDDADAIEKTVREILG